MDFSSISLFNIMKTKLDYLSQRQAVLAQNIANADTPGYKAKDVAAPDFKKLVHANTTPATKLRLAATQGNHIQQSSASGGSFRIIKRANTSELNPNGNNVTIEDEVAKAAQNQQEYQKALNLYSKSISMFKMAIGNPNTGA